MQAEHKKYNMRILIILFCFLFLLSCGTTMKLSIPTAFKEQATMVHVNGARSKKMSFGDFTISKIKRGVHVSYPGWGRGFFLENLLLNDIGLQKDEHVRKEKDKFRFSLSDGRNVMEVFARETELTRHIEYKILGGIGPFTSYDRLQEYRYIFSAMIKTDTLDDGRGWELLMSNIYDRRKDTVNSLFTMVKPDDNGLATNGKDTIFIKGISLKKTEMSNGKTGSMPIKLLSGYELSTADGVVAIIDVIDSNIWLYNELEPADKLIIATISTAIFARRVKDVKW
jgi:hypothetical protein